MKEVKVIKYEAEDGTQFHTAEECLFYEKEIEDRKALKSAFLTIYNYCSKYNHEHYDYDNGTVCGCENMKCPFNDSGIECRLCARDTFYNAYSDVYDYFAMDILK